MNERSPGSPSFRIDIMKHLSEQKKPEGKALIQEQHKYLIL
jgi:hypothetical protein